MMLAVGSIDTHDQFSVSRTRHGPFQNIYLFRFTIRPGFLG